MAATVSAAAGPSGPSFQQLLSNSFTPILFVTFALWIKLVCFNFVISRQWWLPLQMPFDVPIPHFYLLTATLAVLLLLVAPSFLLAGKSRLLYLGALYYLLSLLIIADLLHASYIGCLIPVRRFAQARMLVDVAVSTRSAWQPVYFAYFLDLLPVTALLVFHGRNGSRTRRRWNGFGATVVAGCVLAGPTVARVRDDPRGLYAYTGLQGELTAFIGALPYHALDLVSVITRSSAARVPESEISRWYGKRDAASSPRSPLFGVAAGKNVIQISAESLQAFPIGMVVGGQPITPNLDGLTRESLTFLNFQDQTHLGTTSDAELLTNQSLFPLSDDVATQTYVFNRWRGTAAILAGHGYDTYSACGAPAAFWSMDLIHKAFGFRQSFFESAYADAERIAPQGWISDRAFLRRSVEIMKSQKQPFFAYLLSSTNHDPFLIPRELKTLDLSEIGFGRLADYLHSVHLFDAAIGEFLAALKEADLLDSTVLVIYGDHHGFMQNHPELARVLGFDAGDEFAFWRNRKRVPLWIRLPKAASAGARTNFGGHLDVAPTILSLLGIDDRNSVMMGRDLTAGRDSMVIFRDGSYVDGRYYFVNSFGPITRSRCYSVATFESVDCRPLAARRDQAVEQLRVSDSIVKGDLIPEIQRNPLPHPK